MVDLIKMDFMLINLNFMKGNMKMAWSRGMENWLIIAKSILVILAMECIKVKGNWLWEMIFMLENLKAAKSRDMDQCKEVPIFRVIGSTGNQWSKQFKNSNKNNRINRSLLIKRQNQATKKILTINKLKNNKRKRNKI